MNRTRHIGHQVVAMMDRLGISPITRNYHLLYLCIANSDPNIRQAVRNLGRQPPQRELDQVIENYCPEAVSSTAMNRHENAVLRALDELAIRLKSEHSELSSFHRAIGQVSNALVKSRNNDGVTTELLLKVVGAIDYAGKERLASGRRVIQQVDTNRSEIDALREELVEMRKLANTDALTGLANRRSFDEVLARTVGDGKSFAMIVADIDHFKKINDEYGHTFGDHALKAVARSISSALRSDSFLARTGGEEFTILTLKIDQASAMTVAERVRRAVEELRVKAANTSVKITISLGGAMSTPSASGEYIFQCADQALYQSKAKGRNRATFHSHEEVAGGTERYKIYKN